MTVSIGARAQSAAPLRLVGPADWCNDAACRSHDPELFFPIGNTAPALAQLKEAKAVCNACLVRELCLQWALRSEQVGQENGVYGGLSEGERRAIKRRAGRASRARQHPDTAASGGA
jgi:WhiB family transcriptional regulator, redox-sensing transcriptional regulator